MSNQLSDADKERIKNARRLLQESDDVIERLKAALELQELRTSDSIDALASVVVYWPEELITEHAHHYDEFVASVQSLMKHNEKRAIEAMVERINAGSLHAIMALYAALENRLTETATKTLEAHLDKLFPLLDIQEHDTDWYTAKVIVWTGNPEAIEKSKAWHQKNDWRFQAG